jgi:hypothetical protein
MTIPAPADSPEADSGSESLPAAAGSAATLSSWASGRRAKFSVAGDAVPLLGTPAPARARRGGRDPEGLFGITAPPSLQ